MDDDLIPFDRLHHDDFQEVPGLVGSDDKPSVGLARVVGYGVGIFKGEHMVDGMEYVGVGYAVFAGRTMDFH